MIMDQCVARKDTFYRQLHAAETPQEFMTVMLGVMECLDWWRSEGYCYKGAEIARDAYYYMASAIDALGSRQWAKKREFELVQDLAYRIRVKYEMAQMDYRQNQVREYEAATLVQI